MSVLNLITGGRAVEDLWRYSEKADMGGVRGWLCLTYYEELREKVRANLLPWTSLYLLNPRCSWEDIQYIFGCAAVLVLLRLLFCGTSSFRSTKPLSLVNLLAGQSRLVRKGKLHKFAEVCWYFCWHTTSLSWGLWLLYKEAGTAETPGWVRHLPVQSDGRWFWFATDAERATGSLGWPLLLPSESVRYFYLTQLSFWVSSVCYLFADVRRSDDLAMAIHHAATVFLISVSYVCSYWRLGLVVLTLHDVVDVFLYLTKALHYTFLPGKLSETAFAGLLCSYFVARLLLFPLCCVRPVVDLRYITAVFPQKMLHCFIFPGGILLPALLVVLLVLHVYWFYLLLCMLARVIRTRKVGGDLSDLDDLRSEPDTDATKEE